MKKTAAHQEPTSYLKYFIIFVIFAAIISLFYRGYTLFKESSFKYDSFNILFLSHNRAYVVGQDSEDKKVSVLKLNKKGSDFESRSKVSVGVEVGVPIDAVVKAKSDEKVDDIANSFLTTDNALSIVFSAGEFSLVGLNQVDLVKSVLNTKGVEEDRRKTVNEGESLPPLLFRDKQVFSEKESVQIINATDINGLGTQVSDMLENAGYNVVSVASDEGENSYIVVKNPDSVTANKLKSVFDLPFKEGDGNLIADITVFLGKDYKKQIEE